MKPLLARCWPATRMRRLRSKAFVRDLVRESQLQPENLILPLFLIEGRDRSEKIASMPGCQRQTIDRCITVAKQARSLGIPAIALFPVIDKSLKTAGGENSWHADGLVPEAVKALKDALPEMGVITDVALDPYTSHGQDGLVDPDSGEVQNDETVAVLCKQALCHARAGADMVAPSDMMDGRIAAIRNALEQQKLHNTLILSYAAKYASSFYGPFRDAVASSEALAQADKKSYQMDPGNRDEALHECAIDLQEGADLIMVKPAMPCLDIIYSIRQTLRVPVFAYQVSGEYTMLSVASQSDALPREQIILESLLDIKRAGANSIFSYFALEAAQLLNG